MRTAQNLLTRTAKPTTPASKTGRVISGRPLTQQHISQRSRIVARCPNASRKGYNMIHWTSKRVVLTTALLLTVAACKTDEPTAPTNVIRPVLSTVVADVETIREAVYPGRAQAVRELNIAFEVDGKILTRFADVGTIIEKGDVLATLDPEPYLARVRALEGQRAALIATLENAETELARREQLVKNNHVAQARVDDQIALVRSTKANIEAIEGSLDEARLALGYTTLTAPFDGTVSETFAEQFQNTAAGQPILRILDTSRIEMEISVPESLISLEPYVQNVDVEFSSLPDMTFSAQIARVGNEASLSTRTYPVTIVMDQNPDAKIHPGMAGHATAQVKLPESFNDTGILVPAGAVFSPNSAAPNDTFVWSIDPATNTVSATPVVVKSFVDRGLLVSGITPGTRIATAGANTLTEGQEVSLIEQGE